MSETLDLEFVQKHAIAIAWLVNTILLLGGIGWMRLHKRWILPKPMLWLSAPWLVMIIFWFLRDLYTSLSRGITDCPWRRCSDEAVLVSEPVQFWLYLSFKCFGLVVTLAVLCLCVFLLFRKNVTPRKIGA